MLMRNRLAPLGLTLLCGLWLGAFGAGPTLALAAPAPEATGPIIQLNLEGIVDPVMAKYVERGVRLAEKKSASLLVLLLDTPGGLDPSMRRITKELLNTAIPSVVYVHPAGGRAASAGAFIGQAATVLALTPGTNIGAAHPVDVQGKKASDKVANDATAYLIGLARQRGRNEKLSGQMVTDSLSLTAEQAVQDGVADILAATPEALWQQLSGRRVAQAQHELTLHVTSAAIQPVPMRMNEQFLHALTNPNVTYVLFLLGTYGLIYELANPGAILPGVAGAICLLLALMGFEGLPISLAGVLLLGLGALLLVLEVFVVSHGILATGGVVALILGSFMAFPSELPAFKVATSILITMIAVTVGYVLLFLFVALRLRRAIVVSGTESLLHAQGTVKASTLAGPMVHVRGDDWLVTRDSEKLKPGQTVEVLEVRGLKLKVRAVKPAEPESAKEE